MSVPALHPVSGLVPVAIVSSGTAAPAARADGFTALLVRGLEGADAKVSKADALIEAFAKGEPIAVHQVTLALQEARIAVELATQVRARLLESYRELMSMQL